MTSNNPFDLPTGRPADDVPAPLPGTVEDPLTYDPAVVGTTGTTGTTSTGTGSSAKEQASHLADEASQEGGHVAHVAGEQAKNVASEAGTQAKNLLHTVGDEVRSQAANQQSRVAGNLRNVGDELSQMAQNSDGSGTASNIVNKASEQVHSVAQWLEDRDPADLLDEVKSFARRRPGLFIGIAAGVGILAGRITRAVTDHGDDSSHAAARNRATGTTSRYPDDTTATATYVPVSPIDDVAGPLDDTIVPAPVLPPEPGIGSPRTDGGL